MNRNVVFETRQPNGDRLIQTGRIESVSKTRDYEKGRIIPRDPTWFQGGVFVRTDVDHQLTFLANSTYKKSWWFLLDQPAKS